MRFPSLVSPHTSRHAVLSIGSTFATILAIGCSTFDEVPNSGSGGSGGSSNIPTDAGDDALLSDAGLEDATTLDAAPDAAPRECTLNEVVSCYTGPFSTKSVGICKDGSRHCEGGKFGACVGEVLPAEEVCNGLDDNCDGVVDEGCSCTEGESRSCYSGPVETANIGACSTGLQHCVDGQWASSCEGETTPSAESCNNQDDNCDGIIDNLESPYLYQYNEGTNSWSRQSLFSVWTGANAPSVCGAKVGAMEYMEDYGDLLVFTEDGKLHRMVTSIWEPPIVASSIFEDLPSKIDGNYQMPWSWARAADTSAPKQATLTFVSGADYFIYIYRGISDIIFGSSGVLPPKPSEPEHPPRPGTPERWTYARINLSDPHPERARTVSNYEDNNIYVLNETLKFSRTLATAYSIFTRPGSPNPNKCYASYYNNIEKRAYFICED